MKVLGIETSCDETAAAIVEDGRRVLSNVVFSQVDLHRLYGGVVPEVASRSHVETLPRILTEAVDRAGLGWSQVDAVAMTYGPGLATSLLVGIAAAKGLALRLGKPLCGVNHLEAHIYSAFLEEGAPRLAEVCPFVALVISGGHTSLLRVEAPGKYRLLGRTIDDAAGEAFDKGAKLLGLGYPGGPVVDKLAKGVATDLVRFPRGQSRRDRPLLGDLDPELCFSFSGLKTALLYYLRDRPLESHPQDLPAIVASYQEAIVDAVVERCRKALRGEKYLAAVGGVSLNSRLRARLGELADAAGVKLLLARPTYCTDNAAMVAGLAGLGLGVWGEGTMALDATPGLELGV